MNRDPALKRSLSPEDIERLGATADFRIVQARTPGLRSLSELDTLFIFGILLIVSAGLYTHFYIRPFLPITISPALREILTVPIVIGIGISVMRLLWLFLNVVYTWVSQLVRPLIPRWPHVTCPDCGTRSSLKRYVDEQGCRKCHSMSVYCAKCGQAASAEQFLNKIGCPHCGNKQMSVRW